MSERLGHADVAITMRTYQHVTQHDDRAAAEVLGRILGGAVYGAKTCDQTLTTAILTKL